MTDLEKIENEIKKNKEKVDLADLLIALEKNKHYKKFITEGYLKTYALGMLTFQGSMAAMDEKTEKHVKFQLSGVSGFQQFLANVRNAGIIAKEDIAIAEEEREIILNEEVE